MRNESTLISSGINSAIGCLEFNWIVVCRPWRLVVVSPRVVSILKLLQCRPSPIGTKIQNTKVQIYLGIQLCQEIIKGQLKSKSRQCIKDLFFIWNTVSKIISLEQFYKPCSKTFTLYIGKLSFLHVRTLNQHQCITNPLKSETKGRNIN